MDLPHSPGWVSQDTELLGLQGHEHQEQPPSHEWCLLCPYCSVGSRELLPDSPEVDLHPVFVMAAVITIMSSPVKGCRAMSKVSAEEGTDTVYSSTIAALSIGCYGGKSFWMQES